MKPPDAPHDFTDLVNGQRPALRSAARPVRFEGGEQGHFAFNAQERAERNRIRVARYARKNRERESPIN